MNLQAYKNDESLKQSVLAEMAGHREAERLVQGYAYWERNKGCAVGCLIKSGNHAEYEPRFGIPRALAYLEDRIFEGLPVAEAQKWPERFLGAINTGADLSLVGPKLTRWVITDPEGIRHFAKPATVAIFDDIAGKLDRRIAGENVPLDEWRVTRHAAYANRRAAAAAAYTAAYAYAAAAAAAAAYAAAAAAAYAAAYAYAYAYAAADADAYAAADAYAYAAADAYADADAKWSERRLQYFIRLADKLIELLADAK